MKSKLIFPNPFTPMGIEFELTSDAVVSLTILDQSGHDVEIILNNKQYIAGRHTHLIDLNEKLGKHFHYRLVATSSQGVTVETKALG